MAGKSKSIFSFGNTPVERRASWVLFLIGLGTLTQINIGGYTAISEFLLVLFLPVNLLRNQGLWRRDGLLPFIWLLVIWMAGVCFTDLYVGNYFGAWIRGMIPPVGILAALAGIYPQVRKSPSSYKWFIVGMVLSSFISIYVFQPGAVSGAGIVKSGEMSASDAMVAYKLFWVNKVNEWVGLPIKCWYQNTPRLYSVAGAWFMAFFALLSGGRSSFAASAVSALFVTIGGTTRVSIARIKKYLPLLLVLLMSFMPVVKYMYKIAAEKGWMGEVEREKYYEQGEGKSILQTIMSGRSEFFVGLFAIKDHPLMGHGSYAMDCKGYQLDFCLKYGTAEDYKRLKNRLMDGVRTIPAHSHIIQFWLWAGLPGLLPWIYIVVLLGKTLFLRLHTIPAMFGFFALALPIKFWDILFSPFGSRIYMAFIIALCVLVREVER